MAQERKEVFVGNSWTLQSSRRFLEKRGIHNVAFTGAELKSYDGFSVFLLERFPHLSADVADDINDVCYEAVLSHFERIEIDLFLFAALSSGRLRIEPDDSESDAYPHGSAAP